MSKKAKPLTKTQLTAELAKRAGLEKKQAVAALDALEAIIASELRSKGTVSPLPGLLKINIARKKATKARMGRNPRTGDPVKISAKPAKNVVRVRTLKRLKDMA